MPTFIFTLVFLNEKKKIIRCKKVHSVNYTSLTFIWEKLYKRHEVNSELAHLLDMVFLA